MKWKERLIVQDFPVDELFLPFNISHDIFLYLSISHRESSERSEFFILLSFSIIYFPSHHSLEASKQQKSIRKTQENDERVDEMSAKLYEDFSYYYYIGALSSLHESRAENKTTTRNFYFQRLASSRFSIACENSNSHSLIRRAFGWRNFVVSAFAWNTQILPLFLWISDSCSDKMEWNTLEKVHTTETHSIEWIFVL